MAKSLLENICLIFGIIICCPFICILYLFGCGSIFKSDDDDDVDIERVTATTGNVNRAAVIPAERQVESRWCLLYRDFTVRKILLVIIICMST